MLNWPAHLGRVILDTIDSTNLEAQRRVGTGDQWILTHAQPAGTGRRGKVWEMPAGNFAASLLMHSSDPLQALAQRSFVAALALRDALIAAGARNVTLKWPNDVLVNGRKIAGILLATADGAVVIGIGVNLAKAPDPANLLPDALSPIALNNVTGAKITAEEFLETLAVTFEQYEQQMRTYGFAPIRQAWLDSAARLGEVITARMPDRTEVGTFDTIDETGALVLCTAKGVITLPAAEVFF
ncbi:MAG: biotin--[acetyl-CoA-carboxylase] ligase [Rhodobacteraceae bacterium]|nr:biotin--[acetyl-CoA-carboxylase] ligase [Paracoccaceae bacterium]